MYQTPDHHRRCVKCHVNLVQDPERSFHHFPHPGQTDETILRARIWARYCYPDNEEQWSSYEALEKLHRSHKVLCDKHFDEYSYTDLIKRRLRPKSIPVGTQDLLQRFRNDNSVSVPESQSKINDKIPSPKSLNQPDETGDMTIDDESNVEMAAEPVFKVPFTWQKTDDEILQIEIPEDGVKKAIGQDVILCNVCQNVIPTGSVRVVCVTCWDYDMCMSCAASGAHDKHYALTVPVTASLEEARAVLQRVRQVLIGENGEMLVKGDDCVVDVKQEKEEYAIQVPDIDDDCVELDVTCESFVSAAVEAPNQEGESIIESSATDERPLIILDGQSTIETNTSVQRPVLVLDGTGKGDALSRSNKRSRITQQPQNPIAKICQNNPLESGAQVITNVRPTVSERMVTNIRPIALGSVISPITVKNHTNVTSLVQGKTVANIRHIVKKRVGENTKPVSKRTVTTIKHAVPEKVITNIKPIILKKRPKGPGKLPGQMRLEVQLVDLKYDKKVKITR